VQDERVLTAAVVVGHGVLASCLIGWHASVPRHSWVGEVADALGVIVEVVKDVAGVLGIGHLLLELVQSVLRDARADGVVESVDDHACRAPGIVKSVAVFLEVVPGGVNFASIARARSTPHTQIECP